MGCALTETLKKEEDETFGNRKYIPPTQHYAVSICQSCVCLTISRFPSGGIISIEFLLDFEATKREQKFCDLINTTHDAVNKRWKLKREPVSYAKDV